MNPLAFLNTFIAPARNAVLQRGNQFLRNQAAAAIRRTGTQNIRNLRNTPPGLRRQIGLLGAMSNVPVVQGSLVTVGSLGAADISNRTGFTRQIEDNINKVGPALDSFFAGITPEPIQQYGREQEKKGWGGALETASYLFGPPGVSSVVTPILGSLVAPLIPNSATVTPAPVNPRQTLASLPADYKKTELQAGAAAEAFRPGAGFPGQQPVVQPEVVQPVIDASLPLVGNIGALTGNDLYKAAREADYDNLSQLGLSQWANYYQGRLPQATSTLAATVESEEAKARKFLDTYLKKGEQ